MGPGQVCVTGGVTRDERVPAAGVGRRLEKAVRNLSVQIYKEASSSLDEDNRHTDRNVRLECLPSWKKKRLINCCTWKGKETLSLQRPRCSTGCPGHHQLAG